MRLQRIRLADFRNVEALDLDTDAAFTVLHGPNAQGKTNILEAVAYLANLASFRTRRTGELIRWGQPAATVEGRVRQEGLTRTYRVRIDRSGRRAWVDGSTPARLRDYFAGIRAVVFAPEQVAIVRGSPALRRAFLDRAAFTVRPGHLELVRAWRRQLDQRSALLRSGRARADELEVHDLRLAELAAQVVARRAWIALRLQGPFARHHAALAGAPAELVYRPDHVPPDVLERAAQGELGPLVESLLQAMRAVRQEELRQGRNLVGPHRDDLRFEIGGRSGRTWGSQGQVRSLVLALRLAELEHARTVGLAPIMLLDDLSGELDRERTLALLRGLADLEVQCVVTTTAPERIRASLPGDTRWLQVRAGRAVAEEPPS